MALLHKERTVDIVVEIRSAVMRLWVTIEAIHPIVSLMNMTETLVA